MNEVDARQPTVQDRHHGSLGELQRHPSKLSTSANNHKLVNVTAAVQVNDSGSWGPNGFTLVSVTSNQANSGLGTDEVPNDIQGWMTDSGDTSWPAQSRALPRRPRLHAHLQREGRCQQHRGVP